MTTSSPAKTRPEDYLAIDRLLSDEERDIRDTVRAFVRDKVTPNNLESVVTYEGTADIHALVVGEALTGLNAFR